MALTVNDVSAGYGDRSVLHEVSASFAKGKITALIGQNGCGKSTLLKAIMGFIHLQSGAILLGATSINRLRRRELARRIAYLPQEAHCPSYMTLAELVELGGYAQRPFFAGPTKQERQFYRNILDMVGLAKEAPCQVAALSGGQRQRAWLAMVLAQGTDIILMDEPVNHLDLKHQYSVLRLIRYLCDQLGKTIVIVLHDINLTLAFCDNVIMLKNGRVVASGKVSDAITCQTINDVFEVPADLFMHKARMICQPFPDPERLSTDENVHHAGWLS